VVPFPKNLSGKKEGQFEIRLNPDYSASARKNPNCYIDSMNAINASLYEIEYLRNQLGLKP
jgi:hypothetical protein